MTRVLLTAFEPYDRWSENASWQAIMDLMQWYNGPISLTTRRYPVEMTRMNERLRSDLQENHDFAIFCGQAPGSSILKLESTGLNRNAHGEVILDQAPTAYTSSLPLDAAAVALRKSGIPSNVSHHAGTYLCNATLFIGLHYCHSFGLRTRCTFLHMPLTPSQVAQESSESASMSTPMVSAALLLLIQEFSRSAGSY